HERQHAIEAFERLLVAFEPLQRVAAVVEGIDGGGLERERLIEARERVLVAAQRIEDQPLVRERPRGARIELERRLDQLERLGAAALLIADDAKHMAGIEVPGLRRKNLLIERLSLRELPLAMAADRAVEQLLRRRRCLPGSLHARRYSARL